MREGKSASRKRSTRGIFCTSPTAELVVTGLADMLQGLAGRPGVEAVVLVSPDGLPIQHPGLPAEEAEALAALAVTAQRQAARLAEGAGRGTLRTQLLEADGGVLILSEAGGGSVLLLRVEAGVPFGDLLYDLRRDRAALGALL
jgi:predicted regulator of Ras-like GTPase activity (Roadblock/LC7/MglB family)